MNVLQACRRHTGKLALLGWVVARSPALGAAEAHPTFEEVSGIIRSNLIGATADHLDWAAVQGLLSELAPRVLLVDALQGGASAAGDTNRVVQQRLFRDSVGYVRFGAIEQGVVLEMQDSYRALTASNNLLTGLVLDLRGASGDDYAAALGVVDLFLTREVPLLNWGEGLKSSRAKEDAITLPLAVLVDARTGGAAEALAGMLRQSGVALILGGRTSGTAGIKRAFPLQNGQFLKVTVSNVQLGDAQLLSVEGLKPDVVVDANPATGQASASGTAAVSPNARRTRLDEADLMRRWRGEMLSEEDLQQPALVRGPEAEDPVLVRALDLMDGLAILRSWQK